MKKYLSVFFIFILFLSGGLFFFLRNSDTEFVSMLWQLLGYFSFITILFHYGITKATESRPQVFVHYYMASTTLKLLLNLGIIVVYSMLHREMAVHFIISFMILYFLFTIFEVAYVWKTIRKK